MSPTHIRLLPLAVSLLLTLAACGEEEKKSRITLGDEDFGPGFTTRLEGTGPLELITCSNDPTPQISDDERTLCLRIHLDAAKLSAAGAPTSLTISGGARLEKAVSPTPASFDAGPGHSPVVVTAWATVGCYAPHLEGPFDQQLEGKLELEQSSSSRLTGRVVLSSEGELSMTDCGERVGSAGFDFHFDVAR